MKNNKKSILKTLAVFIIYLLITYVLTGIGYSSQIMPLSNMPIWLGTIFFSFIMPTFVYFSLIK